MSNLKKILCEKISCKSIWFMRQAGRYLPEFREIRKKNKDFIKLCLDHELSSQITLQPIKRFNLDSAIIFSDILMIPYALGQGVEFIKDHGPELSEINLNHLFSNKKEKEFIKVLSPVYKAIEITRKKLDKSKSLICFVGAPWTLLVYMLKLKNRKNEIQLDKINNKNFEIENIINELVKYLCIHIKNQINAGADVVQIFDSWAGLIPNKKVKNYCFAPAREMVKFCKENNIPNIYFPKGLREKYESFNKFVNPDGINLDPEIDPLWAKDKLKNVVLQGGLDPKVLLGAEEDMFQKATKYIQTFKDVPYVFNLGHGLLPETDPDRVKRLIEFYRKN